MTEAEKEKLLRQVHTAALKIYRELKTIQGLTDDPQLVNHLLQMVNGRVNYHMNGDGSIIDGVEIKEVDENEDTISERLAPGDVHSESGETELPATPSGQGDTPT